VTKAAFRQSWGKAFLAFATGEAVSLVNIFTQPTRASRDLNDYETKFLKKKRTSLPEGPEHKWTLGVWPAGVTFTYEF